MKKSEQQKGIRRRKLRRSVVLMLAAALITVSGVSALADGVDTKKPVSVTVNPGGDETMQEDIAKANVVVDLYKVADAVALSGSDGYTFEAAEAFASLSNQITANDNDNAAWRSLANAAAGIALGTAPAGEDSAQVQPVVTGGAVNEAINKTDAGADLASGLYLVIAHGSNIEDYMETVKNENNEESLVTIARSAEYTYSFLPELVALPGKDADENGVISTANSGDWQYDVTISLKPQREHLTAGLQITKKLERYETKDPATFVFDIEAELDGRNVYSDVVTLTFTDPGMKTTLIEDIPVGAVVTVTETYSGHSYDFTSGDSKTAVIEANKQVEVAFTNTYDETFHGGGSIVNKFEKHDDNWDWVPIISN